MPESSGQPTVLVVEGERDLCELYADWLKSDYAVRTAPNGETGIGKLDENVDIVLLDRRMPGLSGDEVIDKIRDRPFACRVVMVTAVDPEIDIIEMGFDDYLVEPVSSADLSDTVEQPLTCVDILPAVNSSCRT